jgi:hypothetical protein
LDNPGDAVRLNAFKGDDVLFMFPLLLCLRSALDLLSTA